MKGELMYKVKGILRDGHLDLDDYGSFELPSGYVIYFSDEKGKPIIYPTLREAKSRIKEHQEIFKGQYDYFIETEGDSIAKTKE
jgi:hypothetical protein